MRKKHPVRRFFTLLLIAAIVAGLAAMPMLTKRDASTDTFSILNGVAERRDLKRTLLSGAPLESDSASDVSLPSGVKVTEYLVASGDLVKAGDPIARVDDVSVMAAVQSAQESMDTIAASLQKVRDKIKPGVLSVDNDGALCVSGKKIEDSKVSDYMQFITLSIQHRDYEEILATLLTLHRDGIVKAPCDGMVGTLDDSQMLRLSASGDWKVVYMSDEEIIETAPVVTEPAPTVPPTEPVTQPAEPVTIPVETTIPETLPEETTEATEAAPTETEPETEETQESQEPAQTEQTEPAEEEPTEAADETEPESQPEETEYIELQIDSDLVIPGLEGEEPATTLTCSFYRIIEIKDSEWIVQNGPTNIKLDSVAALSQLRLSEESFTGGTYSRTPANVLSVSSTFTPGDVIAVVTVNNGVSTFDSSFLVGHIEVPPGTEIPPEENPDTPDGAGTYYCEVVQYYGQMQGVWAGIKGERSTVKCNDKGIFDLSGVKKQANGQPGMITSGTVYKSDQKTKTTPKQFDYLAYIYSNQSYSASSLVKIIDLGAGQNPMSGLSFKLPSFSFSLPNAQEGPSLYSTEENVLTTVTPMDKMWLTLPIDELDVAPLHVGMTADVTLEAIPNKHYTAKITEVSMFGYNSGGSSKFDVTMEMDCVDGMLPGMNANVSLELDTIPDCISVPVAALSDKGNSTVVYTAYDEKTGEMSAPVTVTLGVSDGENVQILSGLPEGTSFWYSYYDTLEISTAVETRGIFG